MTESTPYSDAQIGNQLRLYRKAAGMTQRTLAGKIGITFQQVQKYENGLNRLSAARLYAIAHALQVPVRLFFPGGDMEHDLPHSAFTVARNFSRIPNDRHRDAVATLVGALSSEC
ncbi:MAG: helix-turn-helix transcriptional regulator [Alphaproteobacteria bacterium]|nr:helix-turn-helix transcriptional regulator [Alphaproteobacteria bacterium]